MLTHGVPSTSIRREPAAVPIAPVWPTGITMEIGWSARKLGVHEGAA